MIEVWESLDCESVGAPEIIAIEKAVGERFGPAAADLADSDVPVLALAGGTQAWVAAGLPLVQGDDIGAASGGGQRQGDDERQGHEEDQYRQSGEE